MYFIVCIWTEFSPKIRSKRSRTYSKRSPFPDSTIKIEDDHDIPHNTQKPLMLPLDNSKFQEANNPAIEHTTDTSEVMINSIILQEEV